MFSTLPHASEANPVHLPKLPTGSEKLARRRRLGKLATLTKIRHHVGLAKSLHQNTRGADLDLLWDSDHLRKRPAETRRTQLLSIELGATNGQSGQSLWPSIKSEFIEFLTLFAFLVLLTTAAVAVAAGFVYLRLI